MTLATRIIALATMLVGALAAMAQQPATAAPADIGADDSVALRVERALAKSIAAAEADTTATQTLADDSLTRLIQQVEATTDSIEQSIARALEQADSLRIVDSVALMRSIYTLPAETTKKPKRDWNTWRPNPQRALWLALVIPGGGQIYNRKYWKLPIIYGGFMGCLYALNWNNMMYMDYSQAYLDIMDDDPTTQSYNQFLHLGRVIDSSNEERYKQIFRSRRDRYRRWRDLSFFCMLGVYALSVIDAYVDAELSEFDISKDLTLRVEPAVMTSGTNDKVLEAASFGIQCKLRF